MEWVSGFRKFRKKRSFSFKNKQFALDYNFNLMTKKVLENARLNLSLHLSKEPGLQEFYIGGRKLVMGTSEISRVG